MKTTWLTKPGVEADTEFLLYAGNTGYHYRFSCVLFKPATNDSHVLSNLYGGKNFQTRPRLVYVYQVLFIFQWPFPFPNSDHIYLHYGFQTFCRRWSENYKPIKIRVLRLVLIEIRTQKNYIIIDIVYYATKKLPKDSRIPIFRPTMMLLLYQIDVN